MKSFLLLLFIFSLLISNPSSGQKSQKKITISGFVLDANRNPVQGAIILIDNQKTNFQTDERGFYKIRVSPKALSITIFTIINGVSETKIDGRTEINFTVKTSASLGNQKVENISNEETVNVGYGTMKKKDMTTSVGKIDGTNKKFTGYMNIYDMISGEVPGVQVRGHKIMIQGPSSINSGNEPLFLVDNVIVSSIDGIPPQMVKSIEILKGAAASIYGSRGANGVILIYLMGANDKRK